MLAAWLMGRCMTTAGKGSEKVLQSGISTKLASGSARDVVSAPCLDEPEVEEDSCYPLE